MFIGYTDGNKKSIINAEDIAMLNCDLKKHKINVCFKSGSPPFDFDSKLTTLRFYTFETNTVALFWCLCDEKEEKDVFTWNKKGDMIFKSAEMEDIKFEARK
jgi:hypothetical protein